MRELDLSEKGCFLGNYMICLGNFKQDQFPNNNLTKLIYLRQLYQCVCVGGELDAFCDFLVSVIRLSGM